MHTRTMTQSENQVSPEMFGSDRVYRRGDALVVYSMSENLEWEVRANRKVAIIIGDDVWCVSGRDALGKHRFRYLLEPWPEHIHHIPGRRVRYDADYVRKRDETRKRDRWSNLGSLVLVHFRMLIGFLPSGLKTSIEQRFGISSRSCSFASIMLELFIFFGVGAIAAAFSMASMVQGSDAASGFFQFDLVSVSTWIALILLADLIVRYDSYWRERGSPFGLLEWTFGPLLWIWTQVGNHMSRRRSQAAYLGIAKTPKTP